MLWGLVPYWIIIGFVLCYPIVMVFFHKTKVFFILYFWKERNSLKKLEQITIIEEGILDDSMGPLIPVNQTINRKRKFSQAMSKSLQSIQYWLLGKSWALCYILCAVSVDTIYSCTCFHPFFLFAIVLPSLITRIRILCLNFLYHDLFDFFLGYATSLKFNPIDFKLTHHL